MRSTVLNPPEYSRHSCKILFFYTNVFSNIDFNAFEMLNRSVRKCILNIEMIRMFVIIQISFIFSPPKIVLFNTNVSYFGSSTHNINL